ncbi:hypothetical protein BT96DRAFT_981024 [Gymnopus androsaceus JB14]|uniref:Uncharacterized protein n=1 Tax=Gymnopus androsaceus JB14 TaxID=1447944 RepID=A0A6A4GS92_9AGAR|nr:hypothetical protein BT96DRAFT_981024 [Gymnopus androsaceus JB14]
MRLISSSAAALVGFSTIFSAVFAIPINSGDHTVLARFGESHVEAFEALEVPTPTSTFLAARASVTTIVVTFTQSSASSNSQSGAAVLNEVDAEKVVKPFVQEVAKKAFGDGLYDVVSAGTMAPGSVATFTMELQDPREVDKTLESLNVKLEEAAESQLKAAPDSVFGEEKPTGYASKKPEKGRLVKGPKGRVIFAMKLMDMCLSLGKACELGSKPVAQPAKNASHHA